ncbi:MAG: hypothetical protein B9S26_08760 [Opitutia bacterium Tous-C4FEB]|nr:MAG: hypothetical protein B9S35_07150 [Opitutae bacterium Tous-C5TDCM]PAW89169.1 MAG: hypothetical protein B9S26_08760 [Opitutae bacterium Tous-C4FEB]
MALHLHRVFGTLKTWLNETHHGAEPNYLQHCTAAFVFQFNRCNALMTLFQSLLRTASSI